MLTLFGDSKCQDTPNLKILCTVKVLKMLKKQEFLQN